jgi:hypothetical protein
MTSLFEWQFTPFYQFCELLDAVTGRGIGDSLDLGGTYTSFTMYGVVGGLVANAPSSLQFRLEGSNDNSTWSEIVDSGSLPGGGENYGPYTGTGSYQYVRGNLEGLAYGDGPPTFSLYVEATP